MSGELAGGDGGGLAVPVRREPRQPRSPEQRRSHSDSGLAYGTWQPTGQEPPLPPRQSRGLARWTPAGPLPEEGADAGAERTPPQSSSSRSSGLEEQSADALAGSETEARASPSNRGHRRNATAPSNLSALSALHPPHEEDVEWPSWLPRRTKADEAKYAEYKPPEHFALLDHDPASLACQISLLDFGVYRRIQPEELLSLAWMAQDKASRAPHVVELTERFNATALWVQGEVLARESARGRAEAIAHLVVVGARLLELGNFHGAKAVCSGLQSTAVHRLRASWALVKGRDRERFDRLALVFSEEDNKRRLREAERDWKRRTGVPHLGVYLTDLVYVSSAHADNEPERRSRMQELVQRALAWQGGSYSFHIRGIPYLQEHLDSMRPITGLCDLEEERFWHLSLAREPRVQGAEDSPTTWTRKVRDKKQGASGRAAAPQAQPQPQPPPGWHPVLDLSEGDTIMDAAPPDDVQLAIAQPLCPAPDALPAATTPSPVKPSHGARDSEDARRGDAASAKRASVPGAPPRMSESAAARPSQLSRSETNSRSSRSATGIVLDNGRGSRDPLLLNALEPCTPLAPSEEDADEANGDAAIWLAANGARTTPPARENHSPGPSPPDARAAEGTTRLGQTQAQDAEGSMEGMVWRKCCTMNGRRVAHRSWTRVWLKMEDGELSMYPRRSVAIGPSGRSGFRPRADRVMSIREELVVAQMASHRKRNHVFRLAWRAPIEPGSLGSDDSSFHGGEPGGARGEEDSDSEERQGEQTFTHDYLFQADSYDAAMRWLACIRERHNRVTKVPHRASDLIVFDS